MPVVKETLTRVILADQDVVFATDIVNLPFPLDGDRHSRRVGAGPKAQRVASVARAILTVQAQATWAGDHLGRFHPNHP
jgi:hypothetical protein